MYAGFVRVFVYGIASYSIADLWGLPQDVSDNGKRERKQGKHNYNNKIKRMFL